MTRVLLVTGSRSLAAIPGAEAWARGLIREALDGVGLLIVGDAPGPDAWAWDAAATDRWRYWTRRDHAGSIEARYDDGELRAWWTWATKNTHPLARNAAMVSDAVGLRDDGATVTALALLDGTKRNAPDRRATRGTEHTAGLAERAGIEVTRRTWPETEGR